MGGGEGSKKKKGERESSLIVESVSTRIPTLDKASGLHVYSYYVTDSGKGKGDHPVRWTSNNVCSLQPQPSFLFPGKDALLTGFLLLVFSL
jgi:hypothetical protein